MYKRFGKRFVDIVLSLIGILISLIPMLIIAIAIKLDSPGPILFKQKRIAVNKGFFYIFKFRSMPVSVPRDVPTHKFKGENMLSNFQKTLRKYSLDELPQLFNILLGDMSFVGPRPALWNQYDLIEKRDEYGANNVKPGLTGWAQINGRDELSIDEKVKLDGYYVENLSFLFDCKCFFSTISPVIKHKGFIEGGSKASNEKKNNKAGVRK